jgi:hypothetical protein
LLSQVAQRQNQEEGSGHENGGSYDEDDFEPEEVSADSPSQRNDQTSTRLHGEGILETSPRPLSARRIVPKIDSTADGQSDSIPQLNQSGSWKMETVRSPDQSTRSMSCRICLAHSHSLLLQSVLRALNEIKIINLTSDELSRSNSTQNSYPIWMT